MAPSPIVTIGCHHHWDGSAPCLVLGQCRETVGPALAHFLSSQTVVTEGSPFPPTETGTHALRQPSQPTVPSVIWEQGVWGQAKSREWGRTVPTSSGFLSYGSSVLKPDPEQSARGSLQKKAEDQGLILGSSWASSVPGLQKPPGQEENLSGEPTVPEGGRKPAEWGSH